MWVKLLRLSKKSTDINYKSKQHRDLVVKVINFKKKRANFQKHKLISQREIRVNKTKKN
jgi:hypothetical protein